MIKKNRISRYVGLLVLVTIILVGYAFYLGYPKGREMGHPRPEKWEIADSEINQVILKASVFGKKDSYRFPIEIELKDSNNIEWIIILRSVDPQTWVIQKQAVDGGYKSFLLQRSDE